MDGNQNIREATFQDADKIVKYLKQIGGESDNLTYGELEFNISTEEEEKAILAMKKSPNSVMLLYIVEDEIASIGTIRGFDKKRLEHRGVMGVSVLKKYWNQKIATQMVENLIYFAKENNIQVLEVQVRCDNLGSLALCKKFQFQPIGRYEKFFRINGNYFDAYLLNLYL